MRIIIVEQDAALGVFLTKGLMMQGHDVKWTDGAEEALALAQAGAPNLMVIDVSSDSGTGSSGDHPSVAQENGGADPDGLRFGAGQGPMSRSRRG